jgi:hypothetical protein
MVLWKAIVAIAQGEKQPLPAVLDAVTTMQRMASVVSDEDGAWFDGMGINVHWTYD